MIKKNIPNILSIFRILSVPAFLYCFFADFENHNVFAIAVFTISGITDVIDGHLARKNNWITTAGKILDPLADKLVQLSVLVALAFSNMIRYEILAVFVVKELITLLGFILVYRRRAYITVSNIFGKLSTVSFYVTMGIIMLLDFLRASNIIVLEDIVYNSIVLILCVITALIAIIAILKYVYIYKQFLNNENNNTNTKAID